MKQYEIYFSYCFFHIFAGPHGLFKAAMLNLWKISDNKFFIN